MDKTKNTLIKNKSFQLRTERSRLNQINKILESFISLSSQLKEQIEIDEKKSGIHDINHFAYPATAKAYLVSYEKLQLSIKDLEQQKILVNNKLAILENELISLQKIALSS